MTTKHPLPPAAAELRKLLKQTRHPGAQRTLRFVIGLIEDHVEQDLTMTPVLQRLDAKGNASIRARDRLAQRLGLPPGTPMLVVLEAADRAIETSERLLQAERLEAAAEAR